MPELPEVKVVCKALRERILHKTIKNVDIYRSKLLKNSTENEYKKFIINETIDDVFNVAKHIIFKLSNKKIIISHLRMEGKYRYFETPTKPVKHTHIVYTFTDNSQLHYLDSRMFGTVHISTLDEYLITKPLVQVAKTPDQVDVDDLFKKTSKSQVAIKTIILNQQLVSGIGNIYADECLFSSKVYPATPAKNISKRKLKEILANASSIMNHSEQLGGSTINSYESLNKQEGSFQNFLQVHTKVNKPCPVCKTTIKKIKVNGRGTYYCPRCQKENQNVKTKKI